MACSSRAQSNQFGSSIAPPLAFCDCSSTVTTSYRRAHPGADSMKRTASAIWSGDLKSGHGALATHSGVLKDTPYSFATRFEAAQGTNPEELIAAAHAGCFTMALSASLGKAGFTPKRLATQATVSLEQVGGNWTITSVLLENEAWIP